MIRVSAEGRRGCGYRKVGGLYLVCDGPGVECGGLPLVVETCPTCSAGIKPTRGWTWINPKALFPEREQCGQPWCATCPANERPERSGLIWVGTQHYATPADFTREAQKVGVSRRISTLPKDFKVGETWIFLGHRRGMPARCTNSGSSPRVPGGPVCFKDCKLCEGTGTMYVPAIFHIFRPSRIEQIVGPEKDERDDDIQRMRKRGIEPVIVERLDETGELIPDDDDGE